MNTSVTSDAPQGDAPEGEVPKTGGSTVWDALFMVFLVLMLAFVAWVGMLSFAEGMKNEVTKRNGEAWAKWLGDASAERFKPGFAVAECAAGASAEAVAAASPAAAKEAAKPEDAAAPPASPARWSQRTCPSPAWWRRLRPRDYRCSCWWRWCCRLRPTAAATRCSTAH